MDYPFLFRKSMALGFRVGDLHEKIENLGILFTDEIEELNEKARRALLGENEDLYLLAKTAIFFHRRFSFYLENFEIEKNYYLSLADKFASKIEGEVGKYMRYQILKEKGDLDGAQEIIDELIEEYGRREYMIEKGKLLVDMEKWGAAIQHYNTMLQENEDDKEVWKLLAYALYKAEKYEDAERAYLRVLEMDSEDSEAWYYRGLCLKAMDKWGGALQSFQSAVRKNPKFLEAYEEILSILEDRGMYNRALSTLLKMKEEGFEVDERIREMEERVK